MKRAVALFLALPLVTGGAEPAANWLRLSSPNFEVFTSASEGAGRDLSRRFEQIRGFFQKASPVPLNEEFPVRIIAFSSREQFAPFAPNNRAVSFYTSRAKTDYIVIQDAAPESYGYAIHEYVHLLIRHSGLKLPIWLNEGWADVYSTLRPVRGGVAVGDLLETRVKTLSTGDWLDLETLGAVTTDSKIYTETNRVGIFYAESWALVHMLFLAPDYSDHFPKFLMEVSRGRSLAEACQSALGRTPQQVAEDMRNYLKRKKMYGRIFKAPLGKAEGSATVRDLTDFESRLLLADLSAAIGNNAAAQSGYADLARKQAGNPELLRSMGFFALSSGDREKARLQFEQSFAAGGSEPLMCLQLGLLDIETKQPFDKAIAALERAVSAKPGYTAAAIELGLADLGARHYERALEVLLGIPKVTAEDAPRVFWGIAYAYFESGDLEKARANALTAKKWVKEPKAATGIDEVLTLIEARAKGPLAPHPGEKLERMEGVLAGVECAPGVARMVVVSGQRQWLFDMPDPTGIEFLHPGGGKLTLGCGRQQPVNLILDYAPASVMKGGPAGIVRRITW